MGPGRREKSGDSIRRLFLPKRSRGRIVRPLGASNQGSRMRELLERERELEAVEELLNRRSGALAIEGGVGIGKTSLVQATCRRARELDYEVLSARGSELEADFAFGVVRQLLERRLTGAGAQERASLLA